MVIELPDPVLLETLKSALDEADAKGLADVGIHIHQALVALDPSLGLIEPTSAMVH